MAAEKAEIRKIEMKDGRVVEFAGKRKMLKDPIVEGESVYVRFDFDSGDTIKAQVPPHHILYSAGHGYGQKLGDSVAGMKNEDGSPVSSEDMFLNIEELHSTLAAEGSTWNQKGEGGGFGGQSILMRALVEHSGLAVEKVKEFLSKRSAQEKLALRSKGEKIGKNGLTMPQTVEKLEAEKRSKAPNIDTDALMAGELGE